MTSIRSRLTTYLIGGIGLLIVAAGFVLEFEISGWLEQEFDRALEAKARALVTLTKEDRGEVELDFADEFMPEFESLRDPHYFELWLDDDVLIERSRSYQSDRSRSKAALPRGTGLSPRTRFADIRLPDGRSGRLAQVDFVPQSVDEPSDRAVEPTHDPVQARRSGLHTATILVARERETLDRHLYRMGSYLVLFVGLLLGTLAALVAVALKIGLRPLDSLVRQVRRLDASSLDRRVGVESPPRELAPVIEQINQLLARLEAAFLRERRLTSDIAHELKTPIAELRSLGEVGARWPDDPEATGKFFEDAQEIALQMERIVGHLLALARADEGKEGVVRARLNVADECNDAWRCYAAEALERGLEFRNLVPEGESLESDPYKLRSILSNLFSNAVEYSRPGTQVTCRFTRSNGATALSVSNCPVDLEIQDLRVMFDRFWRKDAARTGGRNIGLGLAIVQAFADLLGSEIDTRLDSTGLLTITLSQTGAAPAMVADGPGRNLPN